jgi:hypothetical protein
VELFRAHLFCSSKFCSGIVKSSSLDCFVGTRHGNYTLFFPGNLLAAFVYLLSVLFCRQVAFIRFTISTGIISPDRTLRVSVNVCTRLSTLWRHEPRSPDAKAFVAVWPNQKTCV